MLVRETGVGVGPPVSRTTLIALMALIALALRELSLGPVCTWGGEVGPWTGIWSVGPIEVILVLVESALDVRRLPGLWFVSLRGVWAVEGAAVFREWP